MRKWLSALALVGALSLGSAASAGEKVRMYTNLGLFDVELYEDVPVTVENFLHYVNEGFYDGSIIHRVDVNGSFEIIQGGGWYTWTWEENGNLEMPYYLSPDLGAIENEFSTSHPNVRGTIAMARSGELDSAQSGWFINTADNSAVFNAANPYCVFGDVVNSMGVCDAIAALTTWNMPLAWAYGTGWDNVLTQLPLTDDYTGSGWPTTSQYVRVYGAYSFADLNEWTATGGGEWSGSNWTQGEPIFDARLGSSITAPAIITLTGTKGLAALTIDSANSYTLGGSGALVLDNGYGEVLLEVLSGSHEIACGLTYSGVVNRTGAGTLTLSGPETHPYWAVLNANGGTTILASDGGTNLTVNANANVTFVGGHNLAAMNVGAAGAVALQSTATVAVNALAIAAGGTLDIQSGQLRVNYSGDANTPIDQVRSWVASSAITSSTADPLKAVACTDGEADDYVLVLYTWNGDATVDGQVTGADLAALATNWNVQSGATWADGDFNGDGQVTGADLAALATNWNKSLAPAGASSVPEPATLALLAMGGLGLLRRRTRRG